MPADSLALLAGDPDVRVAITGATGWIGTALAHLCLAQGISQAHGRLRLFGSQTKTYASGTETFQVEALENAAPLGPGKWLIFHLAFLGKERTEDLAPHAFARINDAILAQCQALVESAEDARLVFSSSGAVYAPDRSLVDVSGNAYGYMKVLHEERIRAWAGARSLPLITVRIFNIGGPYINKQARYALSDFIQQGRATGCIDIGAKMPVFRSFVQVEELCWVLFDLLIEPPAFVCFDTAGRETVEIADLARSVGRVLGMDLEIRRPAIERGLGSNWYVGDSQFYQSALAKSGRVPVDLDEIIRQTAAFMGLATRP